MSDASSKAFWIDCARRKHECWDYDIAEAVEVEHRGETLQLLMPEYLATVDIITLCVSEDLLFAVARYTGPHELDGMGVVLVGRQRGKNTYAVHVWHELYPWALQHLGLTSE